MARIQLTNGKFAIVDDEDFEWLSKYKWCADSKNYVVRHQNKSEYGDGKRKMVKIHRFIIDAPEEKYVDHINHNPLDNRKCNLRIVNSSQNQMNSKLCSRNVYGFKGIVSCNLDKSFNIKKSWAAQIYINGKRIFKGMFETKEEAAKEYNKLAIKYFGEFANLNKV